VERRDANTKGMGQSTVRIGFAGYGNFGQFLAKAWSLLDNVKVVAAATHRHPAEELRIYDHWEKLLLDDEVDLVVITTPPNLHAAIAGAAMEAGKHVLIEKPVATAVSDAERLLEIRDRTKRVASVDFMMRFTPLAEILAQWANEKPFGELRHAVVENHAQDENLPPEHWFWDPAQSGGILIEHAGHFFDLIASFTHARPTGVEGWSHRRSDGLEDTMFALVSYDNGLTVTHHHTFTRPAFFERTTIRLWYDLAELELEGWLPISGKIFALTNPTTKPAVAALPNFSKTERAITAESNAPRTQHITVGGRRFVVSHQVEGTFGLRHTKREVYAKACRAVLNDLLQAIVNPSHKLRAPLESGIEALKLGVEATKRSLVA
jgi:predicted dehydrogenase